MRKKKNEDEQGFISDLFSTAPSLSCDYHIEFNDDREVIAEGCMGIMSCSEEQIKLNMGKRALLITGCSLVISGMFGRTVCIRGRIISAEFI